MPAPLNPPPVSEAGAVSTPRQLQRWLDVNKVNKLTRTETYFQLPVFTVNNNWLGYSEIAGAFNFSSTNNFSLPLDYAVPTSPNYVACIMWVDSNYNVYRYKLWENVGEVFFLDIPLYSGQIIEKHFRIEMWNVAPASILTVTMVGAANANANGVYNYSTSTDWPGVTYDLLYNAGNLRWLLGTTPEYINYDLAHFPFGLWRPSGSAAPAPYGKIATTASQLTALTFYTSVAGNYDYQWQVDNSLATASVIITSFSEVLVAGAFPLPFTWPAASVPVSN